MTTQFAAAVPTEPANKSVVIDCTGLAWQRKDLLWYGAGGGSGIFGLSSTWANLLIARGPVTLLSSTDLAAVGDRIVDATEHLTLGWISTGRPGRATVETDLAQHRAGIGQLQALAAELRGRAHRDRPRGAGLMPETAAATDRLADVIYDERAPLVLELDDQLTADIAREYLTRRRDEENEALANAGSAMEYWHRDQRDRIEQLIALLPPVSADA